MIPRRLVRGSFANRQFWEISVEGTVFTIKYGRLRRAEVDTYAREHETPEIAIAEAEKLVAQRLAEGYRDPVDHEIPAPPPPGPLLEQVLEHPDDDGALLVYADHLGGPRGELIVAQLRGVEIDARKHLPEILENLELTRGFVRTARLVDDLVGQLAALMLLPDAMHLEHLRLGVPGDREWSEGVAFLVQHADHFRSLRRLEVGAFEFPDECELSWANLGDVSALFDRFPRLAHLELQGGSFDLGESIAAPRLRRFELRTGSLDGNDADLVANGSWPLLEELVIWTGQEEYGATTTLDDLRPILDGANFPKLRSLTIANCEFTDTLCTALQNAPISARLEHLDLSLGTMTDAGANALVLGSFPKLRGVCVDGNFLTSFGLLAINQRFRLAMPFDQRTGEDRYPAFGE